MRRFLRILDIAGILFAITTMMLWANMGIAQIEWEKCLVNPVLDLGPADAWDESSVSDPTVLFDGSEYKMWYSSSGRIGYATSADGIVWGKHPDNPVLEDESSVSEPNVLFDGSIYKMWYSGSGGIGYATSSDGIVWEKHPDNPVLDLGPVGAWDRAWDSYSVSDPTVLFDGGQYKMWYSGYSGSEGYRIGCAISADGIVWEKHPGNPVLDLGPVGEWDSDHVTDPTVLFDGSKYRMWYSGRTKIGYATSADGIVWKKYALNPVLNGAWYYDTGPTVLFDGSEYKMWYSGAAHSTYRIGYARSVPKAVLAIERERKANKGDSFFATIDVEDVINLAGFELDIAFDPAILEAAEVKEGAFLSDSGGTYWLEPEIDNAAGKINNIACAKTGGGGVDGSGTLAIITFKAVGAGKSYIRLQSTRPSNPTGQEIPATVVDGIVTVIEFLPEDINKDGAVGIFDLVLVGQHFGEDVTTPLDPNPDVNGDGKVDILDLILVGKRFGESYSSTAPSRDLWSFDAIYLPVLVRMYNIMAEKPDSGPDFLATKRLLHSLIFNARIDKTEVFQNFPNPFNPETWIPYQLAEDVDMTIRIYGASGELVRTLNLGRRSAGFYVSRGEAAYWDGKNEVGEQVSSGIYFYTIRAGEFIAIRKMLMLK